MLLYTKDIAGYLDAEVLVDGTRAVKRIDWDTRKLEPGFLFLANKGATVNGHDFCLQAMETGVSGIIVSEDIPHEVVSEAKERDVFIVRVDTPAFDTIQNLARAYRKDKISCATVIGVTGSVGKTTTKEMLYEVLSERFSVKANYGNFNSEWGVSQTLLSADEDTQIIICEMGMRNRGDIRTLCDIARPDMGIITKIGTSHIGRLGGQEAIAEAKRELFDSLPQGSIALMPANDPWRCHLVESDGFFERCRLIAFGGEHRPGYERSVWHEDVELDSDGQGMSFHVVANRIPSSSALYSEFDVRLGISGVHNADNACAVIGCALALGMSPQEISRSIVRAKEVSGRQGIVQARSGFTIIDGSYNASPESVEASLALLEQIECSGKRIVVLGDMEELGDETKNQHEKIGRRIAKSDVLSLGYLVTLGEKTQDTARGAMFGEMDPSRNVHVDDIGELGEYLAKIVEPDDIVLVKASNAVGFNTIVEELANL